MLNQPAALFTHSSNTGKLFRIEQKLSFYEHIFTVWIGSSVGDSKGKIQLQALFGLNAQMLEFCSPGGDSQLAPVEQAPCLSVDRCLPKTDTKSVKTESQ